jgi:hypothetical protein
MEKVEKLINQLFPDDMAPNKDAYKSFYFQPDKVQVSSENNRDNTLSANAQEEEFFNNFQVTLPRPALNVKSFQLTRASIPNIVPNIPDTETTFWYYRVPGSVVNSFGNIFNPAYLKFVRLLPSWYKPELNETNNNNGGNYYGFNRSFQSYQDLQAELAKSCLRDPIKDNDPSTTLFVPGDISITFNETQNKFVFTGNNALLPPVPPAPPVVQYFYIAAGYTDPNVVAVSATLQQESRLYDQFGLNIRPQQFQPGQTLNLRLGFTWDGTNRVLLQNGDSALNVTLAMRFRPTPTLIYTLSVPFWNFLATSYTAESYADLVNTSVVNLYADIVSASTVDTLRQNNFLGAVAMNTANLGVAFSNPVISTPLTKIQTQIYQIQISMFDDKGLPFNIPNSATVSLEFAFTY